MKEDIGWKKSKLETNHLSQYIDLKGKKKKTICESNEKHKEQQKDKHEDVKKRHQNHKRWRRRVRKIWFVMYLSLYDYQAKARRG